MSSEPTKTSNPGIPEVSSTVGIKKRSFKRKQKQLGERDSRLPGVQKIKSALRQTRRLLSKDNLAANLRVETERRLKTLEAELVEAEACRKERELSIRYHKVKFFERKKVTRKLLQVKNRLASADATSKQSLESALLELRVNLNYTLHYPRSKKYISLFTQRPKESIPTEGGDVNINPESEEVRSWILNKMEDGKISVEPENHSGLSKKKALNRHFGESAPTPESLNQSDLHEDRFFGDDDIDTDDSE